MTKYEKAIAYIQARGYRFSGRFDQLTEGEYELIMKVAEALEPGLRELKVA